MIRIITLLLTAFWAAIAVHASLPASGNCSDFAVPTGDQSQNRPDQSFELKVENLVAEKTGSSVSLSITGITNQFAGGAGEGNDFIQGAAAWFVVQRCDVATGQFSIISDSTASRSIVAASAVSSFSFSDSTVGNSRYYYAVYATMAFAENFGNVSPSADTSQSSYDSAVARFANGDATTKITWSAPLYATVSFLPEQDHVVYNSSDSSNFSTDVNGFIVPASAPVLASTTLGESVNYTFTTTSEFSTLPSTLTYEFSYSLKFGSTVTSTDFLTFTTTGASLNVSGTVPTNSSHVKPGTYTLTVTAKIGTAMTASADYSWTIKPRPLGVNPSSGVAQNVEIGYNEDFTITRVQGFSEPSVADFVTVSFSVSNFSTSDLVITEVSTTSNSATFNATLPDNDDLVGLHSFEVTVTESCNQGAPSYCESLKGSYTTTLQIQALGHDFNFSASNRSTEAGINQADLNTYYPIYFDSNQLEKPDFVSYSFEAVNMKSASNTPLKTADFEITSFLYEGASQAVSGSSVSAGGVTITTPAAGTSSIVTMTVDSDALTANETFAVTITALSETSKPTSTSVIIRFIALEATAPTVTSSAVLDDNTGSAYSWPGGFSSSAYPARTDARISVTFSEDVTGPTLKFGISSSTVAFDSADVPATTFTKVVTSGALLQLLGSGATTQVNALFGGAVDQINRVKQNDMIDSPFVVTLAQTPEVDDYPAGVLKRNESFSVALSEVVTEVNPSAFASTNLNGFSVSLGGSGDSLVISPLPGRDLANNTSATLTLNRGAFFNAAGYPNISTSVANLTFETDSAAPVLQAVSFQSSDRLTNVTYVLTFNEVLVGNAGVVVKDLTNGGNVAQFDVVPSSNMLTISTAEALYDNTEYQFVVSNISDGASNKTTVVLDAFITLGDDAAKEIKDVSDAKKNDTTRPTVLGISPNYDLAVNKVNQPLRPLFKVAFSEYMQASTTESVVLTDDMNSTNGVGVEVVSFDGVNLVFYPSADLHSGEDYWLSFDITKAIDLKSNQLEDGIKYSFKTFSPNLGIKNDAPVSLGLNLNGVIDQGTKPRFYFNEPVDVSTLSSAISIKNAAGELVGGLWAADGSDAVFNTDGLEAGGSYTYMFWTSRVADVLGKANALGVKKSGAFTVRGDTRVRNFNVRVSDSGAGTLNVTGSWLPPVDKAGITGFTLSYVELSKALTEGAGGILGSTGVSGARFTTSGVIDNLAAGKYYRFKLSSIGTTYVETVDVTAVPAQVAEVDSELVSVLAHTSVEVGSSSTAKITIKPGDLKGSAQITVAEIDDPDLKAQSGGGTKYSDIIQFEPHGLSFNRPVDFALKISTDLSVLAASCGVATNLTCEADLLDLLNPLTFDAANARWTGRGLAKSRVEVIDGQNALVHARTPHFSSFVISQAFTFASTAPADGEKLSTATIGQTTYVAEIPLTGTPNSDTVAVSFSPDTFGFEFAFDGDTVRISNTSVQRPAADETASVTVTVTVTDVSSDTTVVRALSIPILDLSGDPGFAGTPVGVDFFRVSLETDTSAKLTWAIPESDKTSRTIDMVYIEYRDISAANSQTQTVSVGRGVSSTTVPVSEKKNYSWNIFTKSAQGVRSDKSTDIERFTYGYAQTTLDANNDNFPLNAVGVPAKTISVKGINLATEAVDVSQFSAADISDLSDAKILSSTTTLQAPYGSVEFIPGTLMDLNFGGSSASVCYSVATTESLAVYHYVLNSNGSGYWEELPTSLAGGKVLAGSVNANANCLGNDDVGSSAVTIQSAGAGSPFAVGPKLARPVVIRSGGGGCSVVEGHQTSGSTALINLLVMLLPLLLIAVKRFK